VERCEDAEGRPSPTKKLAPLEGHTVCPGALGTTNFMAPTYDPQTSLFYVTARDQCAIFSTARNPRSRPRLLRSAYFPSEEARPYWDSEGIDPTTGQVKWKFQHTSPPGRAYSPRRCLVFQRRRRRKFHRLRCRVSKPLWHFQMGGAVYRRTDGVRPSMGKSSRYRSGSAVYCFRTALTMAPVVLDSSALSSLESTNAIVPVAARVRGSRQ